MIDQTKDQEKREANATKDAAVKDDAARKAQQQALAAKEQAELEKGFKGGDKVKVQPGNNASKGMQPIGSARIIQDKAEVHSEPVKKGVNLGGLSAQRQIDILEVCSGELKVLVDGKVGYISKDATDYAGARKDAPKAVPEAKGSVTVTVSALRIRQQPEQTSNYLGTLREQDKVKIYGEKNGYLEVRVGGQIGYISAEHTDYTGSQKRALKPQEGRAVDQAPAELQELLSKETLTAPEISSAKALIAQCPEGIRGELNEALQLKPHKGAVEPESGDAQQFGALAASLELLGIQNPSTDRSYASYLAQLKREQHLPENGGMGQWGSIVNAMGVSYGALSMPGDREALEKAFWSEKGREQLRDGHAVMACIDGQAVRIEAIENEGLVMTLPDGAQLDVEAYSGHADQKSSGRRGLLKFEKLSDVNLEWVIALG